MADVFFKSKPDAPENDEIRTMYADVNIYMDTDPRVIKAHKVNLAQRSPWFHTMFQNQPETKMVNVVFFGIPYRTIQQTIEIIYGKCVTISQKDKQRMANFLSKLGVQWKEELQFKTSMTGAKEVADGPSKQIDENITENNSKNVFTKPKIAIDQQNLGTMNKSSEKEIETKSNETDKAVDIYDILDTWTQSNPTTKSVEAIKHTAYKNPENEAVNIYKCTICVNISRSFEKAKQHFMYKHMDTSTTSSILLNAEIFRRENIRKVEELEKNSDNISLITVHSQLRLVQLYSFLS